MKQTSRVSLAQTNHKLFAFVLDSITLFVSTFVLYFVVLYGLFATCFHYVDHQNEIKNIEIQYRLDLDDSHSYDEYEAVLQDFYFNKYPDEIKKIYNDYYKADYSIIHIYNINVLNLPTVAKYNEYKTDYYQYVQNDDGTFNVDVLAIKTEGSGKVYEKNMHDLFYNSYIELYGLLRLFHGTYNELISTNDTYTLISRIIAFIISFIILFVVIPLLNKYGCTLFEKIYKITMVKKKNGYLPKKGILILKSLVTYLIPFFGVIIGSRNSLIIFAIGYLLINFLMIVLSKDNKDIAEKLLRIYMVSIDESLLFKNSKEEKEYFDSPEGKALLEPDALEKLSSIKEINVIENVDENKK